MIMNYFADVDLTDRAIAGGWDLPEDWSVTGWIAFEEDVHPSDFDVDDADLVAAFEAGEWGYVTLVVEVTDEHGARQGWAVLGSNEHGHFPGHGFVNALEEREGMYAPIREYDMINEAIEDAVRAGWEIAQREPHLAGL